MLVVARIGDLEGAQRRQEPFRGAGERGAPPAQRRRELPLVDEVDVAAQGRAHPGIPRDAEAFVRLRVHAHPYLAGALYPVDRGDVALGEQLAPAAVGEDHELGDQLIERRAAPARHDAHAALLDVEAVVELRGAGARLAAALFQRAREAPERLQLILERQPAALAGLERRVERLVLRMAQVGRDADPLQARLVHVDIERNHRPRRALLERIARDHVVGQHGELASRHVRGRQALAGDRVERGARREPERGRGDVDADPQRAIGAAAHREGVVHLGGADVVQAEGRAFRERQLGRLGHVVGRKLRAAREELVQKTVEVEIVRVRQQSAAREEPCRREPRALARLLESLRLGLGPVRRIKQLVAQRRQRRGALEALERRHPLGDLLLLALFLFQRSQRELEDLLRRRLEAALSAPMEIHRRGMQPDQDAGGLEGARLAPDVLARELAEAELGCARALPEEIGVQAAGIALGFGKELRPGRLLEFEQDICRLDLAAAPVRALDVQARRRLRQDRADLELAVFFIQDLHGGGQGRRSAKRTMRARCAGKLCRL